MYVMQIAKGLIKISYRNTETSRFIFSGSKRVSAEISNVIQCERCYATSVPSEDPKPKKNQKRLSKAERKPMVEAFVNKYRESNAGNFPTYAFTQKHVGGSPYIVKYLVQEMQFNAGVSPPVRKSWSESTKSKKSLAEGEKVIISPITADLGLQDKSQAVSSIEVKDASKNYLEVNEGLQKSTLVEKPLVVEAVKSETTNEITSTTSVHVIATETHLQHGQTNEVEKKLKNRSDEENSAEKLQEFEDIKPDTQQPEESHLKADKLEMDQSKKQSYDEEIQKTPSIWGSLMSLANGFISMWKKL